MKRIISVALLVLSIGALALPAAAGTAHAGQPLSEWQVTKTVLASHPFPGGDVEYQITVTNPANNAGSLSLDCVVDQLPEGFNYHAGSGTPFEPDEDCEASVAWFFDGEDVAPGASRVITFCVDINPQEPLGSYSNEALVFSNLGTVNTGPTAAVDVVENEGDEPTGCGTTTATPVTPPPASIRTATPTTTATPEATSTSPATAVPATVAPQAPTATPPGGGAGGVIVGPNTGSGGASTSSASALAAAIVALSLLAAGSIALAGAGAVRRRR